MERIKVLTPLIANMIAAGEVLERPASAVKEMVENSIDAKASRIIVEIENGGKTSIKVIDNGIGMSREDAKTCFLRHATSKIYSEEDLANIHTLGFRGEALASIAAVSKVELITRTGDTLTGTKVVIEAGEIVEVEDVGCNVGTSIQITDLFFNTPARMKFLKTDSTEAAYITEMVEKIMIAKPDISIRLIKNGKEALFSAGDSNILSNLTNIYSKEISANLTKIEYEFDGVKISGFIGNEKILRPNRKHQTFFVNDRIVRNKVFYAAVDEAVKEKVILSKYPFVILNIEIDPSLIDINVHPTKAEIKFSDDRAIYGHIYNAIHSVYAVKGMSKEEPEITISEKYEPISFVAEPEIKKENTINFNLYEKEEPIKKTSYNNEFIEMKTEKFEALTPVFKEGKSIAYMAKEEIEPVEIKKEYIKNYKILGQLFQTYIIIEKEEQMYLLDQHAAHERLIYDKISNEIKNNEIIREQLMVPYIMNLTPVEHSTIFENSELFSSIGFDLTDFGNNSIMIREIPFHLENKDLHDTIIDIVTLINENKKSILTYKQEKAIYTLACKAAIKANNNLSELELEKLVYEVIFNQQANTCPHGRPLFISFDKKTIEKQFKRIN